MKKLLIGLLALGLVFAFTAPAVATDMKVSGTYYVWGWYNSNQGLDKDGTSHAWFNQRLRVATVFQVNKALKLSTRFDAMEGYWGGPDFIYDADGSLANGRVASTGTAVAGAVATTSGRNDANIDWDYVYMTFLTKCGKFDVGIMSDGVYGTEFGNAEVWLPKIGWGVPIGKFYNLFQYKHYNEGDITTAKTAGATESDADYHRYMDILFYFAKTWQAGLLYQWNVDASASGATATPDTGYKTAFHVLTPYFKANFGPLYLEGQSYWVKGVLREYEDVTTAPNGTDIDIDTLSLYLKGKYNFGSAYVGGIWAWVSGDEANKLDELGSASGGADWDPCLILWNSDLVKWGGAMGNVAGFTTNDNAQNMMFFQVFGGFSPMEKLDVFASFSYAKANETTYDAAAAKFTGLAPAYFEAEDDYGTELDIKATYKIFDNLSYMVGFGYFWAGDWYKGNKATAAANPIDDNYILFHKLTLNF